MKRKSAVAGRFYDSDRMRLTEHVKALLGEPVTDEKKVEAKAVICPHAGLVYSGSVAGAVYGLIKLPHTFVLLGPNHSGLGAPVAAMTGGVWETPLGDVELDEELASAILKYAPTIENDQYAHLFEHSLEVQLPFIHYLSQKAKIVPITVLHSSLEELKEAGRGIARAVSEAGYPVVLGASTDMSHFVSDEDARREDSLAINEVLKLDPDALYSVVRGRGISMCGVLPTVIVLEAALGLGATKAELVRYATSAEVSGDYSNVVGYAGFIIS